MAAFREPHTYAHNTVRNFGKKLTPFRREVRQFFKGNPAHVIHNLVILSGTPRELVLGLKKYVLLNTMTPEHFSSHTRSLISRATHLHNIEKKLVSSDQLLERNSRKGEGRDM